MKSTALLIAFICLWIPGASAYSGADPAPNPAPLRQRVKLLENKVKRLEGQVETLRTLVCLQLPAC